jgi:hypothetical protein
MREFAYVLAFLSLSTCVPTLCGDDAPKPKVPREKLDAKKVKVLMHRKLENAQKILEALTLNDVDKAAKSAEELIQISKEAEFVVFKTRDYEVHSNDFRRSAETLVKQAKEKNLEAAKLTYLGMTLSCFQCHAYVRDVGMIRLNALNTSQ